MAARIASATRSSSDRLVASTTASTTSAAPATPSAASSTRRVRRDARLEAPDERPRGTLGLDLDRAAAPGAPVTAGSSVEHGDPDVADPHLLAAAEQGVLAPGTPSTSVPFTEPRSCSRTPPSSGVSDGVAARGAGVADDEIGALHAPQHERLGDLDDATGVLAGEHLEPHGPKLARDGVGAQQRRSLTCSCSGENGATRRSSAPAAVTSPLAACLWSTSSRTFASRVDRVGAQRGDDLARGLAGRVPGEDHEVRAAVAHALEQRLVRAALLDVDPRSPTATRATARVLPSTPASSTRGRRAASTCPLTRADPGRAPSCESPVAGTRRAPVEVGTSSGIAERRDGPRRGGVGQRAGRVDHRARGRHQVGAGLEAALGRLLERLGDHRVEPAGQVRAHRGEPRRLLGQVRVDHGHVGVARERQLARQSSGRARQPSE